MRVSSSLSNLCIWAVLVLLNFFFLSLDPTKNARYHGDKHINKMQTEYAQIVCDVWHILFFDHHKLDDVDADEKLSKIKRTIYKKSHPKHPVVLWACKSLAHYNAIIDLGLALNIEKQRRMENMINLPKEQRKKWKPDHKSGGVLQFCKENPPPLNLFVMGSEWIDPPKCMPEYYHHNATGEPFSVIDSYRLFYAGHKVTITKLKWEPFVEEPDFLKDAQAYISTRPDILSGIEADLLVHNAKSAKAKEKREKKKIQTIIERKKRLDFEKTTDFIEQKTSKKIKN